MKNYCETELRVLIDSWREVCKCVELKRQLNEVNRNIQIPKIPTPLPEMLTLFAIRKGLLLDKPITNAWLGNGGGQAIVAKAPDITVKIAKLYVTVEVKGVQECEFITYGIKDHQADYLVCLMFGEDFRRGGMDCRAVIFPKLGNILARHKIRRRITIKQLCQLRSKWWCTNLNIKEVLSCALNLA